MTNTSSSPPNVRILVSSHGLQQALEIMDIADSSMSKDRVCLYCKDRTFVIRQGYNEATVPCSSTFAGQFSMAFSSLQKWKRKQKAHPGNDELRFEDGQLKVCNLSLPTKWQAEIESPQFATPKVVGIPTGKRSIPPDVDRDVKPILLTTCPSFRINVDRIELQDALSKLAVGNDCDIQLRTWGGKLILSDGVQELRADAEGKIDGFSVISAADLPMLRSVQDDALRFVDVICKDLELRILGTRIKVPKYAVPYEPIK